MSTRVALVSCGKAKQPSASPARDLYTSHFFHALRRHAQANADVWYILSANHGLLDPDKIVVPYERTLNRMSKRERVDWAENVQRQLLQALPPGAEIILLAGVRYREDLEPFLRARGFPVEVPLKGLRIGEQLRRLKELASGGFHGR